MMALVAVYQAQMDNYASLEVPPMFVAENRLQSMPLTSNPFAAHSMSYGVAFHFCFILIGYAGRAVQCGSVEYGLIGGFGAAGVALVLLSSFFASLGSQPSGWLLRGWQWMLAVAGLTLGSMALFLLRGLVYIMRHLAEFPQDTNSLL